MGNKIILILGSFFLALDTWLYLGNILLLERYFDIFIILPLLFIGFFFLFYKKFRKSKIILRCVLFMSVMPIVTIILTVYLDGAFFKGQFMTTLLKLFSWDRYEGETRTSYVFDIIFNVLLPALLVIYSLMCVLFIALKRRKQRYLKKDNV